MEAPKTATAYEMHGWRAHLVCDTVELNEALSRVHGTHPDDLPEDCDTLKFEIPTSLGFASHLVSCRLGRPLLSFSTSPGKDTICVRRRFLNYQHITLRRKPGSTSAAIEAITVSYESSHLNLFREFDAGACKGLYEPGKRVRLEIEQGRSSFSIGYPWRAQRERSYDFDVRYLTLPPSEQHVTLHDVDALPASEWLMRPLRFYPRASENSAHSIFYIAWREDNNGIFAPLTMTSASAPAVSKQPYATNTSYMNTYVGLDTVPDAGYRLSDFYSLSLLIHPRTLHGCTGAKELDNVMCGLFEKTPPSIVAVEAGTPPASGVAPLVKMVSASELYNKASNPGAEASNQEPVWIDVVPTGNLTFPLYSTYVVLNRAPTHEFKLSKSGDKLKLVMTHLDANGLEREVDPLATEWSLLAGGGQIDADGVFTPSSSNKFAVILAIEPNPEHHFWAVVIVPVPLMSVDDFLKLTRRS